MDFSIFVHTLGDRVFALWESRVCGDVMKYGGFWRPLGFLRCVGVILFKVELLCDFGAACSIPVFQSWFWRVLFVILRGWLFSDSTILRMSCKSASSSGFFRPLLPIPGSPPCQYFEFQTGNSLFILQKWSYEVWSFFFSSFSSCRQL